MRHFRSAAHRRRGDRGSFVVHLACGSDQPHIGGDNPHTKMIAHGAHSFRPIVSHGDVLHRVTTQKIGSRCHAQHVAGDYTSNGA